MAGSVAAVLEEPRYLTAVFNSRTDVVPQPIEVTWDELAEALLDHHVYNSKHESWLWSPTRYPEGARRGKDGVIEVTLFVADIDDGTQPAELSTWLAQAGCAYLIASTWSHTLEVPHLRAVLPLDVPIPTAEYANVWRRINQHVFRSHIDPSTKDASRLYYAPGCPLARQDVAYRERLDAAEPLDWRALPQVEELHARIRPEVGDLPNDVAPGSLEYRARCFLDKWYRDLSSMGPETGRHNALRSKAVAAGGLIAAGVLAEHEAYTVLLAASEANGLTDDPGGTAERTIRDGFLYGAQTPWRPDSLPDTPAWRTRNAPQSFSTKPLSVSHPLKEPKPKTVEFCPRTAADIGALALPEIQWIAKPWIARGCLTEMDGRAKASGKTTWTLDAVRSCLAGERFLSEPTLQTPVLLLSEQNERTLQQALRRANLLDARDLHIVLRHELGATEWQDVIGEAAGYCRRIGASFLVVDTLAPWLGLKGDAENNSADALLAIQPLQEACSRDDLAILINRHERKSGGEVGESGRGSSAYAGAVDVILALRRGTREQRPTVRLLDALSRYDETPAHTVIELQDGRYAILEDNGELAMSETQYRVISALRERGRLRVVQFAEFVRVGRTQLDRALDALVQRGLVCRDILQRGAFEYYLPPDNGLVLDV